MGEMRDRMLRGELYRADDPELQGMLAAARERQDRFNASGAAADLAVLLGGVGPRVEVRPPVRVDYGVHVTIGAGTFVNFDAVLLDCAPIAIGRDCQLGPRVQLLTPTHPLHADDRRSGWEAAAPIVLGDDVWLGGGAVVCPGVTIGAGTVVGAGAVVTGDLPPGVLAAGVPARVVRAIGDADRVALPPR